jgi:hypothetical protein
MLIFEKQLATIRSDAGFDKSAVRIRACWGVLACPEKTESEQAF